jgi:hypothetical protein
VLVLIWAEDRELRLVEGRVVDDVEEFVVRRFGLEGEFRLVEDEVDVRRESGDCGDSA